MSKNGAAGEDSFLDKSVNQMLKLQLFVALGLVAIVICSHYFFDLPGNALTDDDLPGSLVDKLMAIIYGSILAITGTILSARSIRKSSKIADPTSSATLVPIYSGLLNKLVIVGGGIAFGLIFLKLQPFYVVTAYFVVQMASIGTTFAPKGVRS